MTERAQEVHGKLVQDQGELPGAGGTICLSAQEVWYLSPLYKMFNEEHGDN